MMAQSPLNAFDKLTLYGNLAGLSADQMIRILNAGFTVEALVMLIESRLPAENLLDQNSARKRKPANDRSQR